MTKTEAQTKQILHYLQHHTTGLTAIEALKRFNCLRLAARIGDLRAKGFEIITVTEEGDGKRWARYYLAEEEAS
jgi:hypothetical protein